LQPPASLRSSGAAAELHRQVPQVDSPLPYAALADAVLVLHFAVVLFVVGGLPAIVIGNRVGWPLVNALWLRLAHLLAIAAVVAQAWLGQYCLLTVAESWLRQRAGQLGYESSFIQHWIQKVLFHEAPMWQFALAYTVFGLLVLWAWLRYPPQSRRWRVGASGS
jgi:hypothetical protein